MADKKQVLEGIDNFKKIIDINGYYVDKTLLIKELIDRPDQIVLITRPRRFGKTLNMSMLKYFFEIPECRISDQEDVDTAYLFEGLKIFEDDKYKKYHGVYPVVYLTFKDAKQDNWESTLNNIKKVISKEYQRHKYLLDSNFLNANQKETFDKIMNICAVDDDYTDVIINLTEYLKRYFKKDCYVLIDEYDTPIQAGYINGYFKDVIEFFKSLLVKGFKDNKALKQGVLTGIMKVAQESIFSDFNNPMVATVLSEEYKDKFGFTENEVEQMVKYFHLEDKMPEIKEWYNGYIFGNDTVIYNPWSIIKFIYNPKNGFKPYWINTSDNRIIKEVMQLNKKEGKEIVRKLISGEEVRKVVEENVVYQTIKTNTNSSWSFLLHAGYLKATDRIYENNKFAYKLEIPNKKVRTIYRDMIINFFEEDEKVSKKVEGIIDALLHENHDKFEILIHELYLTYVSFHDTKKSNRDLLDYDVQESRHENFHHGFMLGLLMYATDKYEVYSNKEYGFGRPDIVLVPRDKQNVAYVFEFKWDSTKGSKTLENLVGLARKQIEDKKYIEGIKKNHAMDNVVAICVGFKEKEVLVAI